MTDHTKKLWEQYQRVFIPLGLDPRTAELIRRAYFFGAKDTLDFITSKYSGERTPTEADAQLGAEIHHELRHFANDVFPHLMQERYNRHRRS